MKIQCFAYFCDHCCEQKPMATPEQRKAAGFRRKQDICVRCLKREQSCILKNGKRRR